MVDHDDLAACMLKQDETLHLAHRQHTTIQTQSHVHSQCDVSQVIYCVKGQFRLRFCKAAISTCQLDNMRHQCILFYGGGQHCCCNCRYKGVRENTNQLAKLNCAYN